MLQLGEHLNHPDSNMATAAVSRGGPLQLGSSEWNMARLREPGPSGSDVCQR